MSPFSDFTFCPCLHVAFFSRPFASNLFMWARLPVPPLGLRATWLGRGDDVPCSTRPSTSRGKEGSAGPPSTPGARLHWAPHARWCLNVVMRARRGHIQLVNGRLAASRPLLSALVSAASHSKTAEPPGWPKYTKGQSKVRDRSKKIPQRRNKTSLNFYLPESERTNKRRKQQIARF